MGLKAKLKATVSGLTTTQQAILTFFASALPPVIVLVQESNTNPFLYGAALLGAALATVIFLLGGTPVPVPTPTPTPTPS